MKFKYLLFTLLISSCGQHVSVEEAAFYKVPVAPLTDDSKQFAARGQNVSVIFQSDHNMADIDSFPEPPVIVRHEKSGSSCEIVEGGIWVRSELYLSADERYVLMNEYSGSSADLVSYDTQTCREINRFDVSGMHWDIDGRNARLGDNCTGSEIESCAVFKPLDLDMFVEKKHRI